MKAFSVSVRVDVPQAGTIAISGENKEEAIQKVKVLMQNHRNIEVLEAVEIPSTVLAAAVAHEFASFQGFSRAADDAELVEDTASEEQKVN